MRKLSWLRGLIVPISILSILFVAFVAYYLYWVPSRQRDLDDRGFRYLKTLSDQIRLTVNTYDKMMDNAVSSGVIGDTEGVTLKNLEKFLKSVSPQLVLAEDSETEHLIGDDFDDPPKIAIQADEGTHFMYFAFSHAIQGEGVGQKPLKFAVRTDFDQMINRLLGISALSPFDVVLIAQSDGRVIFQKSLSGVEISQLKNLEDASGDVKGKDKKQIDIGWLSPASRLEEIWIAGARYRLYSQPLPVGFLRAKHPADGPESWVLVGLVRADRFRSESQLIPYSYILFMLAAILLAAVSYPFLKLYLSSPGERLRARDITLIAVFACFVSAVLTFILADIYFWQRSYNPAAEREMAKLAHAMDTNFKFERAAALSVLNKLNDSPEVRLAMQQSREQSYRDIRVLYGTDTGVCDPEWACQVDILTNADIVPKLADYPYPFFAFWSDSRSKQQIKWTTRHRPTPFLLLDDPSVPYYPEVRRALKLPPESQSPRAEGIGSQYSPTTGQQITTFWQVDLHPTDQNGKPYGGDEVVSRRYSYSLVTQPVSLYNAVLPGGYQFAVLTPDGTVVFHSDTTRNLRENFFAETGQNPNLRSRVRMRAEGPVTSNYIGKPHRMYVLPMDAANQDGPWTVVVFRDLHLEEVLNLEVLSLVTILFLLYGAVIALVVLSLHWRRKGHSSDWFWPDSRKTTRYRRAAIINVSAAVVLLFLAWFMSSGPLLFCAAVIPAATFIAVVVTTGRRDDKHELPDQPEETDSKRWQSAYFQAVSTLVVLLAVLPCLCFFRVAADFAQELLVKRTLLKLAGDFDQRALTMQALYQEVRLSIFSTQILAGPDGQHAHLLEDKKSPSPPEVPVFSYHELLNTCVSSDGVSPSPCLPALAYPELFNRCISREDRVSNASAAGATSESSFLSSLSYPYNESAADDRHLAEGKSDVWKWTSCSYGRDRALVLLAQTPDGPARRITTAWQPFYFAWSSWIWWLGGAAFLAAVYWFVRLSFSRVFLLDLVAPPPSMTIAPELNPGTLMADLPMNLLIIGPEVAQPISSLLHRSDVQVREAEDLLPPAAPTSDTNAASHELAGVDAILRDGRPLVLRNLERLADDPETAARTHAILMRLLSALGNSVIIVSSLDPILISSIEGSDRWRTMLQSFVRIDFHATPRRRLDEDEADHQARISANSYFHWLFAGLPKSEKLVMFQLAREHVVNPSSSQIVYELMEQGMIERRHGLLTIADPHFAKFLPRALPHHTVKLWEKEIAGARPFSLQTSLLIVGVGVVAFLIYTQGDVFNTWVTYATGVASVVPKALQFFENFQSKSQGKS